MKDMLVYIWKLLVLLIICVIGFIQDLGGLFYVCTLGEKNAFFPVAMISYLVAFFLPIWGIAFLNNNRKWEDLDKFEKGFLYLSIVGTIVFYLMVLITFEG